MRDSERENMQIITELIYDDGDAGRISEATNHQTI